MKVKSKLSLILILACACIAALVAGCTVGDSSVDDRLKEYNVKVTYFANGGTFKGGSFTEKTLYYRPGSPIYEVGLEGTNTDVYLDNRDGYILEGWNYANVDEEGKFVSARQDKVNFKNLPLGENDHIYLCAVWAEDIRLPVKLVYNGEGKVATNEKEYSNGEVISYINFNANGVANVSNNNTPVISSNATFLEYFADEQCLQPFSGTVNKPADGSDPQPIYAKYIPGKWSLVRTVADVKAMFQVSGNYYFYTNENEKVFDCSSFTLETKEDCNVKIEGNGCTLKNLKFTGTVGKRNGTYSIFGKLGDDFELKNLSFDNVTVTFSASRSGYIHALCSGGSETAKIENVSLTNFKLTINPAISTSSEVIIYNINQGSGYNTNNWICGGTSATDAEFMANRGLTVSGGELYYNGEKIARTN